MFIHQQKLCVPFRYVIVECEDQDTQQRDPKTHEMYLNVMRRFSQALLKVSILFQTIWKRSSQQSLLLKKLPFFHTHTSSPLQGDKSVRVMRSLLAAQQTFVDRLVQLMKAVQRESGNRKKKVSCACKSSRTLKILRTICLFYCASIKHVPQTDVFTV